MATQVLQLVAALGLAAVIGISERERMRRQKEERERRAQSVLVDELNEDIQLDSMIAPVGYVQLHPALEELQDAIKAADARRVRSVLAAMGGRHPDSMKLDRGLTPAMLAAYMRVRHEEHDAQLKDILHMLLQRGAFITQREEVSGATMMHFLACQSEYCSVIHRMRFLLNTLDQYRKGIDEGTRIPGLAFDPVLNGVPAPGCAADAIGTAIHLLGMRCYCGKLPEELASSGKIRNMLQTRRGLLPLGLQDTGVEDEVAQLN